MVSQKTTQRHFFSTIHPLSTEIFATATLLAFVLLRDSSFKFHCYTQREATPTQKSARKCAATSCDFLCERLRSAFTQSSKSASLNRPIALWASHMYSHKRIRRIKMHLLLLWSLEVGFKQLQSLREISDVLREITDVRYPLPWQVLTVGTDCLGCCVSKNFKTAHGDKSIYQIYAGLSDHDSFKVTRVFNDNNNNKITSSFLQMSAVLDCERRFNLLSLIFCSFFSWSWGGGKGGALFVSLCVRVCLCVCVCVCVCFLPPPPPLFFFFFFFFHFPWSKPVKIKTWRRSCDSPTRKSSRQMSAYMLKIYVHSRTTA